jgi:hypothetical protein
MARQSIGDLAAEHGTSALVPSSEPEDALDVRAIAARVPIPARGMIAGGVMMVIAGVLISIVTGVPTFAINAVSKILISVGLGTAFLGGFKRRRALAAAPSARALPPIDPSLSRERRRRLATLISAGSLSGSTFEYLVRESRWMQDAVLSTLLEMKDRGEVIEDLDLDNGQWIYRNSEDPGMSGKMTLDERRALPSAQEDRV